MIYFTGCKISCMGSRRAKRTSIAKANCFRKGTISVVDYVGEVYQFHRFV